jgi:uncharacterized protein
MLIEFKVANFRSFHEEQTFSMVADSGRDKLHPGNLIKCEGFDLLKCAAIYGANASGKSNLFKAAGAMQWLIANSATLLNQGDPIPGIVPFRLAAESKKQPSRFVIAVVDMEIQYRYSFSATAERVYDEQLMVVKPGERPQCWFTRTGAPPKSWEFGPALKKEADFLRERTRSNGLILSRGAELNIGGLTPLYNLAKNGAWIVDFSKHPAPLMVGTAREAKANAAFRERVLRILRHADVSIDGFDVTEQPFYSPEMLHGAKQLFTEKGMQQVGEIFSKRLAVQTMHRVAGSDAIEVFDMDEDESNGTRQLFALLGPFLQALDGPRVLVVDELDCSMHPLLSRKLIELFQSPQVNTKDAQLIFATHDSSVMDPELFRRDQIWLVEKNRAGASQLRSLYDFDTKDRPRNTEAFERNYLAGRYGGVPTFGATFEDLELTHE